MASPLNINDFNYELPEEKIAFEPLKERSKSKFLVYKDETITEETFDYLPNHLIKNDVLVINTTKVIPARLFFTTSTGATVEILCLEALTTGVKSSTWKVFIGNKKRWKEDEVLKLVYEDHTLTASLTQELEEAYEVTFSWTHENLIFFEVLEQFGHMPLPPYIKREDTPEDQENYQTIFAQHKGSIAAPTASLHFDDEVLRRIRTKGVQVCELTLHVGAGTFKPIKTDVIEDHVMHQEYFSVPFRTIEQCLIALKTEQAIFAIGTTVLRTLETVAISAKKIADTITEKNLNQVFTYSDHEKIYIKELFSDIHIQQWEGQEQDLEDTISNLELLIDLMAWANIKTIHGTTQLMITPGFQFQVVNHLVTNFHQPKSTLLLLIAAFIGENWKKVYEYALTHNFRFLSYGDSSLLKLK